MKVRFLTSIAGHAEPAYSLPDFAFSPGDVVDLDKTLAAAWVDAGIVELAKNAPVASAPVVEPSTEV